MVSKNLTLLYFVIFMTVWSICRRPNLRILEGFQKLKAAEASSSVSGKGSGCMAQSVSHIYDIHVSYMYILFSALDLRDEDRFLHLSFDYKYSGSSL